MKACPICGDVEQFKCKVKVADFNKNRRFAINMRWTVNAQVCTNCGMVRIINPDLLMLRGLEDGYDMPDFHKIDKNLIMREMVLPGCHSQEEAVWCDIKLINPREIDDLSNGIQSDHYNYSRLINFLLLPQATRIETFGPCAMPIAMEEVDDLRLTDGRRRASILIALGATIIPLAIVRRTAYEKSLLSHKLFIQN